MRTEFDAMDEAYRVGRHARVPVVISHLKCAGPSNWGRSVEVLKSLDATRDGQPVDCDCYPYNRSLSTLDLKQVTGDIDITITWSTPHPEMADKLIREVAGEWNVTQQEAAKRLQPAGAVTTTCLRTMCGASCRIPRRWSVLRLAERSVAAASVIVGRVSAHARPLRARYGADLARRSRAQDDESDGAALRPERAGK